MIRRILWIWLPVILWAGLIFYFSSYSDPVLSPIVSGIGKEVGTMDIPDISIRPFLPEISLTELSKLGNSSEILRRAVHFGLYLILGIFLTRATKSTISKYPSLWAIGIASLFAFSDEIHQQFVPRRSFELLDIAFDIFGALIGIVIYHGVKTIRTRIKTV